MDVAAESGQEPIPASRRRSIGIMHDKRPSVCAGGMRICARTRLLPNTGCTRAPKAGTSSPKCAISVASVPKLSRTPVPVLHRQGPRNAATPTRSSSCRCCCRSSTVAGRSDAGACVRGTGGRTGMDRGSLPCRLRLRSRFAPDEPDLSSAHFACTEPELTNAYHRLELSTDPAMRAGFGKLIRC